MYELKIGRCELIPATALSEFYSELKDSDFLISEEETKNVAYASLDCLIPTAIGIYIIKPYFESFLKEAGKDHYQMLKKALSSKIIPKVLLKDAPFKISRITSGGRYKKNFFSNSFSITSSIRFEDRNLEIKLLFPENSDYGYCANAIDAFSIVLCKYSDEELGNLLQKNKHKLMSSCFWYNTELKKIEVLDVIHSTKENAVISVLLD